ncbi:MAG: hypothetical protein FJ146_13900 [Deltaproteobacteria bacterium]|nr:hypothetical protein [Deltaproteobacteria bacterium]
MINLKARHEQIDFLKQFRSVKALLALNLAVVSATSGTLGGCTSGSDGAVSDLLGADGEIAAEFAQFYSGMDLDDQFKSKFKDLIDRAATDGIDKLSDTIVVKGQQLTGFKAKAKVLSSASNFAAVDGKKYTLRDYFKKNGVLTERLNAKDLGVGFNMLRLIGTAPANYDAIMKAVSKFSADQALRGASSLVVMDALIQRYGLPKGLTLQSADGEKSGLMLKSDDVATEAIKQTGELAKTVVQSGEHLLSKENANCGSLNKTTDASSDKYNEWQRCHGFGPQAPWECNAAAENDEKFGGDSPKKPATMCSGLGFKWKCVCTGKSDQLKDCKWQLPEENIPPPPRVILNSCKNGSTNVVKPQD